jgi:HK97 family phage portal protein
MANWLAKIFQPSVTKTEGAYHDGPWLLSISGGLLPADVGNTLNWWQMGGDIVGQSSRSAMVEACVGAYSQTVAMCPGNHWKGNDKNGRDRVTTSALTRILRKPNDYQSISDFMLNATRSLYLDGNAYALALRNSRFEIEELHLMNPRQCGAQVAVTGDIFYKLAGNEIIERRFGEHALIVPARDVLHVKLSTPVHPLKGVSPLIAAALDVTAGEAISNQQIAFYMNQAKPSVILTTDREFNKDDVQFLRDRWNEQTRGMGSGGTPILTAGLKPIVVSTTAKDADVAEVMKMSEQRIALAFRVPLQILGLGGTPFASTEALMQLWKASGLGFALNHIEEAFGQLFGLKGQPDEYVEFDTDALLRSAMKDRVDAFVHGVQGGIWSPNEARAQFELPDVGKDGDEPRVQQQVVPLSAAAMIPAAPPAPGPPSAPALPPPKKVVPEKDYADDDDELELGLRYFRASHSQNVAIPSARE